MGWSSGSGAQLKQVRRRGSGLSLRISISPNAKSTTQKSALRTRHFDMILKLRIVDLKLRIVVLKLRIVDLKLRIVVLKLRIVVLKLSIVVSKLRIDVLKPAIEVLKLGIVVLKPRIDDSKSQIDDIRRAQRAPDHVPDHTTCCTTID
jgi:hypothetical protein